MARGLTYAYTGGMPVPNLSESLLNRGEGSFLGVPMPILIFVLIFAILWVVLNHTTYGRTVYAVGGNVKSARTAGIRTKRVTASVYVIAGILAGLGGLILTARTSSALASGWRILRTGCDCGGRHRGHQPVGRRRQHSRDALGRSNHWHNQQWLGPAGSILGLPANRQGLHHRRRSPLRL